MPNETTPPPAPEPTGNNSTTQQVGGLGAGTQPPPPKSLKIKGVEFKSEDDAYAEIERGRQSAKLLTEAQKRLFEASKKEKGFEELVGEVKTKKQAHKLIERLGLSKEEAVEVFGRWLYENEVLPRELDPRERENRELKARLAAKEEEEKAKAAAAEEAQNLELTKREEARLKQELTKLLQEKKVPGTRLALRRLANYLASYSEAGMDVPADRAADMVMEDYRQEYGEMFEEASADELEQFFGKARWVKLCKKVSDWALARARGGVKPPEVKNAVPARSAKKENDGKMTPEEFRQFMKGLK